MKKEERQTEAVEVGARLARARRALGMTQVELAGRLNVEVGNLSNWENGYAMLPPEYAPQIFMFTRIDSNYLYRDDPSGLPGKLQDKLYGKPPKKTGRRA